MDQVFTNQGNHDSWYLGVVLALVSSFIGALGDNIVRLSYIKEEKRIGKLSRPLYKRPLWLLGECLTVVINPAMTILALKFAAASIVVPFGGLHIFWNVCLCGYMLKEKLTKYEVLGSMIILASIIMVVIFGTHEIPGYTIEGLVILLKRPYFIFYSVLTIFTIIILFYLGKVNIVQIFNETFFSQGSTPLPTNNSSGVTKLAISSLCGICGGNGNLFAKACIESLDQSGIGVIWKSAFLLLAFSTISLCLLQAICLTVALGRYEAKFVVPMVNAWLVASGSAGAIILFEEYTGKDGFAMLFFSMGICGVILGIFILMTGSSMLNIDEFMMKDEERSGLINIDSQAIQKHNIITSRAHFKPIDFVSSDTDSDIEQTV